MGRGSQPQRTLRLSGYIQGSTSKAITVPTLVMHGEDDQVVPIDNSARTAVRLLKDGTLKTYPGFSHGMLTVNADVLNRDLLAFVRGAA
ncbi:alpha/beta hydrolase [Sediminicoccus rosea]|uniref:Alpha/beta hydrolase n=1 Tax=Sediminicoccus rosea TaxID=1225128 RepID=A0ABZ0PQN1_9PROT|nr:alpha/beta hydrolase [Sediminicoccus rosea]WPB87687.1 alpha/beta hydrolase [Sediminicoccus rosea]